MHRVPWLLLIITSMAFADPHIENAVAIHTATRDYLEFDIVPWSCGRPTPMVNLELRRSHLAVIQWVVSSIVNDTVCPLSPTRLNMLVAFPDSLGGTNGPLEIDTVLDAPGPYLATFPGDSGSPGIISISIQGKKILTPVAKVRNPPDPATCPMVKCAAPDSVLALQGVVARIRSSSLVGAFSPFHRESFVAISPWSRTTGVEDFPEVVAPSAGNAHNWIEREVFPLAMDSLIAGGIPPFKCGNGVCMYPVQTAVAIPTGPVQYWYQQSTDPFQMDTSAANVVFQRDSVMKAGAHLHLSGFTRRECGVPLVDSELIHTTRWLVASHGSTADSIEASFRLPGFCLFSRPGAWPLRDGRVEIASGILVSLQELFSTTATRNRTVLAARPFLVQSRGAVDLELPVPAIVRIVDLSGRDVLPPTDFTSGRHDLRLPRSNSMLFVQVRTGITTTTLPLEPMR